MPVWVFAEVQFGVIHVAGVDLVHRRRDVDAPAPVALPVAGKDDAVAGGTPARLAVLDEAREAQPLARVHVVAADAQLVALLAVEGERLAVGTERWLLGVVGDHLRLRARRGRHGVDIFQLIDAIAVLHHPRGGVKNHPRGNRVGRACCQPRYGFGQRRRGQHGHVVAALLAST